MVSYMPSVCLVVAALSLGTSLSGQAPQPTPAPTETPTPQEPVARPQDAPPIEVVDEVFVAQTIRNSRAEIEISKIALTKSIRPDVKMGAQRIVDDHTKINAELAVIAGAKKMILPDDPTQKDKVLLGELEKLMGEPFDRTYITRVVANHVRSIDAFREYSEKGTDAVLKAWATKMIPTLQRHLDEAREVEKKLGS
jgi:putative membrane protein